MNTIESAEFDHSQDVVVLALGMTEERLEEIVSNAQKHMAEHIPNGKKTEFLEQMIKQCRTDTEIAAATLTWHSITKQMDMSRQMQQMQSEEFANSLKIRRDG